MESKQNSYAIHNFDRPGTAGAPTLILDNDTNTGIFHPAADELAISAAGSEQIRVSGVTGDASAPLLTFSGDTDTGIFHPAADELAISAAGSEKLNVSSTGITVTGTSDLNGALDASGQVDLGAAGGSADTTVRGDLKLEDGLEAEPSLTFTSDTDTGLFHPAANELAISAAGSEQIRVSGVTGDASAPLLTFSGDTDTGIFHPASDELAFTAGGTETVRLNSQGVEGWRQISSKVAIGTGFDFYTLLADGSYPMSGYQMYKIELYTTSLSPNIYMRFCFNGVIQVKGTGYRSLTHLTSISTGAWFQRISTSDRMFLGETSENNYGMTIWFKNFNIADQSQRRVRWSGDYSGAGGYVHHLSCMGSGTYDDNIVNLNGVFLDDGIASLSGTAVLYGYGPK